jgi:hypothetical protein
MTPEHVDLMSGPCISCGATNYPPSVGGATICPSCDCSPPSRRQIREMREGAMTEIQRLNDALREARTEIERLQASNEHLKDALTEQSILNGPLVINLQLAEEKIKRVRELLAADKRLGNSRLLQRYSIFDIEKALDGSPNE